MSRILKVAPPIAFFLLLSSIATACLFRPTLNGDQFIQAVAAKVMLGENIDRAYEEVHTEFTPIYGEFQKANIVALVPLHSLKVGHIAVLALLERGGVPARRAVILVSCLAYLLIGAVIWMWLGEYLSGWSRALASGVLMLMPLPVELA